jgi:type II secretory pathway component GspD/PulD (secretin)
MFLLCCTIFIHGIACSTALAQQTRLQKLVDAVKQQQALNDSSGPTEPEDVEVVVPSDELTLREEGRRIPVDRPSKEDVDVTLGSNGLVSVTARNAPVNDVLESLAQTHGFNLVMGTGAVSRPLSISLRDVPIDRALDSVVASAGLTWVRRDEIILVSSIESGQANLPSVQNRILRVFELDYASVPDVETSVRGLISPAGQVTVIQSAKANIRQNRNLLVVEDLPEFVERIARYIDQVDMPPRQVLIEARVLQVRLQDDYVHGLSLLYKLAAGQGSTLSISTKGLASLTSSQALLFTLSSENLGNIVELIENTLDSKTLASPRVLALNGQESRIQVGGQLGFRVLTTTQTSTLEQVQFLNTGIILRVTPFITRDNQIMMTINPSVSTGQINVQGLPEAQTTEVATQVLLPDNHGMIIGGLIQENYEDRQTKIPVIGDIKLLGRLFQRRAVDRKRTEVIIALIPRIVPYDCQTSQRDREELARTDAPIYRGDLYRNPRPMEPKLYDATENPRTCPTIIHHHGRMRTDDGMTYTPYPTTPASQACMPGKPDAGNTDGENCSPTMIRSLTPSSREPILLPPEVPIELPPAEMMPVEIEPEGLDLVPTAKP